MEEACFNADVFLKGRIWKECFGGGRRGCPCLLRGIAVPAGCLQPTEALCPRQDPGLNAELLMWLVEPVSSSRPRCCVFPKEEEHDSLEIISALAPYIFTSSPQGEKLNLKSCRVDRSDT